MNKQLAVNFIIAALSVAGCMKREPLDTNKPLPAESLGKAWGFDLQLNLRGDSISALHLRDETLYVYSKNNNVTALSSAAGKLLWNQDVTPKQILLKPPVVLADKVIFPAAATLEIYDFRGKKTITLPLTQSIRGGAVGLGKMLYVGLDYPSGGRLAAIDITRTYSVTEWERMTFGAISAAPALFQETIYVGSEDMSVYAINRDSKPVWPLENYGFKTDGAIVADVKVDESGVYVASRDSKLYCIDRGGGKLRWQYYGGRPLDASPIVTPTMIYQAVPRIGVAAIDKNEGAFDRQPKWLCKEATMYLSEDEKYVYLRGVNNDILAADKTTGEIQFRSKRDDFVAFAQNQRDATIYAASRAGVVLAIKPVLKPGTIGTLVFAPMPLPDALASR